MSPSITTPRSRFLSMDGRRVGGRSHTSFSAFCIASTIFRPDHRAMITGITIATTEPSSAPAVCWIWPPTTGIWPAAASANSRWSSGSGSTKPSTDMNASISGKMEKNPK